MAGTSSGNIPLFIEGGTEHIGLMNLFVGGAYPNEITGSIPLTIWCNPLTGSLTLFTKGYGEFNLAGYSTVTGALNLYLARITYNTLDLFVSGGLSELDGGLGIYNSDFDNLIYEEGESDRREPTSRDNWLVTESRSPLKTVLNLYTEGRAPHVTGMLDLSIPNVHDVASGFLDLYLHGY